MALTNICILKYNNYYNRQYKKAGDVISDYAITGYYGAQFENINFFKGNYVNAELVLNTELGGCDYLIEYNTVGTILSRWFIIQNNTTRAGQSSFTLRRDLFVDFRSEYEDAPAYIEKATVRANDIAIYNQEEITFNEIKQDETLLKDATNTPWIVGYFAPDTPGGTYSVGSIEYPIYEKYNTIDDFYDEIGYNGTSWKELKELTNLTMGVTFRPESLLHDINYYTIETIGDTITSADVASQFQFTDIAKDDSVRKTFAKDIISYLNARKTNIIDKIIADDSNIHSDNPMTYNGIYIKVGPGTLGDTYKVTVTEGSETTTNTIIPTETTETFIYIKDSLNNDFDNFDFHSTETRSLGYKYKYKTYTISVAQVAAIPQYKVTIPATANKLLDAPYKMFAMPLDPVNYRVGAQGPYSTPNRYESLNIATTLATSLGSNLYDLQLLPYCPYLDLYKLTASAFVFKDTTSTDHYDREYITNSDGTLKYGFLLFPKKSNFTFNISKSLQVPNNVVEQKIVNQCDLYRLCSPNYSSMFEFNLLKTGTISKFNVDCTYKPYSPYIHINPNWSKLYGKDFDDIRGLICQGDFSLPLLNDAWTQYEINNKNYLNAFNRQIDSIELNNKYTKVQDIANAITGTTQAGYLGGKLTGSAAGGVVAGAISAGAGVADVVINEKLRNEALDLQKDQFNYNLQNIKALPKTLAKVSSFDYNNKLFPVLEYYSCTDEEKDIFRDKMTYNGMTVNRIGTVSEFVQSNPTYIKGQFIRLEDLGDDYNCAKELASEFYKGVYI